MIINNKWFFSTAPLAVLLASCTPTSMPSISQVQHPTNELNQSSKYPDSVMIYNVCHERWLRNGYSNYTFNVEEGTYLGSREVQRGKFTQAVVANHQVAKAATCSLDYHSRGASCNQASRRHLKTGKTIDDYFAIWEKKPGLYQSCHPVLGYPTGYGHTYGSSERRIDSNDWLLISSVIPKKSSQVTMPSVNQHNVAEAQEVVGYAENRVASLSRIRPEVKIEDYTSVADLEINLVSSTLNKSKGRNVLVSKFDVLNKTDAPALLGIKGWILDADYKRYPLSVTGKPAKKEGDSEIVTLKIEPHTQMMVSYEAEGVPDIKVSKQTIGMLEVMSVDGTKINLSLPRDK